MSPPTRITTSKPSATTSVVVFALAKDQFDELASAQVISYIMAAAVIAPLVVPCHE